MLGSLGLNYPNRTVRSGFRVCRLRSKPTAINRIKIWFKSVLFSVRLFQLFRLNPYKNHVQFGPVCPDTENNFGTIS